MIRAFTEALTTLQGGAIKATVGNDLVPFATAGAFQSPNAVSSFATIADGSLSASSGTEGSARLANRTSASRCGSRPSGRVEAWLSVNGGVLSAVRYPKDVERRFEFADQPLRVYEGTVRFEADLEVPAGTGDASIAGDVSYQACNERQCFAPAKIRLDATIVTSPAAASFRGDTSAAELR